MSGEKYSSFQFDEERQRRSQLFSQLSNFLRQVAGLQQQIRYSMDTPTRGVQRYCQEEFEQAHNWLEQANKVLKKFQGLSLSSSSSELSKGVSNLDRVVTEGMEVKNLLEKKIEIVERRHQDLLNRLRKLESDWSANNALIEKWVGISIAQKLYEQLQQVAKQVEEANFPEAEQKLNTLERELQSAIRQASRKEAEHLRQLQARELAETQREVDSCAFAIQQLLNNTTSGIKETFEKETRDAEQWLRQYKNEREHIRGLNDSASTKQLRKATERLRELLNKGKKKLEQAQHALVIQASELRAQAEHQVGEINALFTGSRELLSKWFNTYELIQLEKELNSIQASLQADRLLEIKEPYQAFLKKVQERLKEAEELEARHQRRLYLLKAIRQVCADMGFREVVTPYYEREGDRRSRIKLNIDTHRGKITFFLSLERIEADSFIPETHCFDEFEKLSEQLKQQFGVHTKFQTADEEKPRLIRKGEKEEPDSSGRTQQFER